ncbi:ATP-binding protein [Campylobacter lari]|uniref:ATP-binding protein n=1 Tax=Campylobacter lari TaxID=201 RepID=UPI001C73AE7C|nr:ATP-binding protein [Campylobacter lari]MBX1934900.1 ATP-binding protein [Campylobacter lari]
MKIIQVKIKNFRGYTNEAVVDFEDLTAFVGKNDIGKSTILEALDIFFNGGVIKIDKNDINKECAKNGDDEIQISVVFDNYPRELVLDTSNLTNLEEEYLLNKNNKLEIIKKYPNAGSAKIFIKAYHPTNEECKNLHSLKITDLKKITKEKNIMCDNLTKSAELRKAIWKHYSDNLQLQEIEIELNKEDTKNIWEQLEKKLPHYALFQSDRTNNDGDNEIQNPLKSAVAQIFKDEKISNELQTIAKEVINKLQEVTNLTLEKLKDMNPEIAKTLNPKIPTIEQLKWADVFKNVSISGDEDIPINKRGSGVKRIILLNFFRAEAERKKNNTEKSNIIYAIEEPETSQHQCHQKLLIEALKNLSKEEGIQIIITTHSPSIVKQLQFEDIRIVKNNENTKEIVKLEKHILPIPSLNEINYLAFDEADEEYHNELYGYIDFQQLLKEYFKGKPTQKYINSKTKKEEHPTKTKYIRDQIHHPENTHNPRFSPEDLQQSIKDMRDFIQANKGNQQ